MRKKNKSLKKRVIAQVIHILSNVVYLLVNVNNFLVIIEET